MEVKVGFVCDRGLNPRRPVNQDRLLVNRDRGLFAVFDGVGGQKAGEIASQTGAETVEEAVAHASANVSSELIRRAIQFANRDIFELAASNPAYRTMATTIALLHLDGGSATIAHVGDSRVYRFERGRFYRETIDHTDLDDDLRAGRLPESTAVPRPEGNVINRALGVDAIVDVEVKSLRLRDGMRFLICSDGIYRHLPDEELARVLSEYKDPQRAADELKRIVFERGADDNLSAIVVQIGRPRQSAVIAIDDGFSMAVDDAGKKQVPAIDSSAGRAKRRGEPIRVPLSDRTKTGLVTQAGPERARHESSVGWDERGSSRPGRLLVYGLVVLILMVGAFYAGLRASDLVNSRGEEKSVSGTEAELNTARQAFDGQRYEEARMAFAEIAGRDPQNAEARYWLGRALLELGLYAQAIENLEQAITIRPSSPDAYVQAAASYEALGDRVKAAAMLSRYAELRRNQPASGDSPTSDR